MYLYLIRYAHRVLSLRWKLCSLVTDRLGGLCQEAARAAAEDYMAGQLQDLPVYDTAARSLRSRHAGQLQPHTWSSIAHRVSVLLIGEQTALSPSSRGPFQQELLETPACMPLIQI